MTPSTTPVAVAGGLAFASLSARFSFTCGVTLSGAAYCWGDNTNGTLGNGTAQSSTTPIAVSGGLTFASVSTGAWQTCGVTRSGAAYCWGQNNFGELGNGTTTSSRTPVPVSGGLAFASLSANGGTSGGSNFGQACAITQSAAAYCWGYSSFGFLGNDHPTTNPTPVAVSGGISFASVSQGVGFACGVTPSGAAYCWGLNGFGELGNATNPQWSVTPIEVSGGLTFAAVSVGGFTACGVTTSGAAYCWGYGGTGALGNGTTSNRITPDPVSGDIRFATNRAP
jgi:alpha-tubulin suppressor-like RCC1 family protein